jgi:hypothetical protein
VVALVVHAGIRLTSATVLKNKYLKFWTSMTHNPHPATVYNNANQQIDVYGDDVEVDYRGYEVFFIPTFA